MTHPAAIVRATFHATYPPHVAGDVAGIGRELADRLRRRGVVSFEDPHPTLDLDRLDRAALVGLARDHLGIDSEPPDDVSDDDLRAALRDALGAARAPSAPPTGEGPPGWDRLDAMDRAHLEAFAADKVGMADVDPEMDDPELRRQIRAAAAATLSAGATATALPSGPLGSKRRPR